MSAHKLFLAVSLASALGTSASHACGPLFPNYLLNNRNANLLYMPEGSFALESHRLVPPDSRLPQQPEEKNDKYDDNTWNVKPGDERVNSLEEIEKSIANLPAAERFYRLGAAAFSTNDTRARDYFRQLLALPTQEQGEWGLKARYSLGRDLMHDYPRSQRSSTSFRENNIASKEELSEAFGIYQQLIDAVRDGQDDPDALSVASLGQQGRIKLWLNEPIAAVYLYAQQAAQGSRVGELSLRYVSRYLTAPENEEILRQSITDPLIQRLIVIYFFTHPTHPWGDEEKKINRYKEDIVAMLTRVMDRDTPGSDRLIALAYRNGQYSLVNLLLKNAKENGLTSWVSAKMALRGGDVKSATAWYAKAAASFPVNEEWGYQSFHRDIYGEESVTPVCRIDAEQAILALNRNDYVEAMRLMYNAKDSYWPDVAWIAERVLTLRELTTFVDKYTHAPKPPLSSQSEQAQLKASYNAVVRLRALLARRLMREGHYQKALRYFDIPQSKLTAQRYIDALLKTENKAPRAQAWWQAALIQREQGMDLTGYEMTPDFALYHGWYSSPFYQNSVENDSLVKSWISAGEKYRVRQSQSVQDNHFMHYRWRAVTLAEKAASFLPPKSQAYAAVLCNATEWIRLQDPELATRLYLRYVKNGAPFTWAAHFGQQCPWPDFTVRTIEKKKR